MPVRNTVKSLPDIMRKVCVNHACKRDVLSHCSPQARAVLDQGRTLWAKYHATTFPAKIRDEYKLNRVDAGWYQIRRALEAYDDVELTDFGPFKAAYADLTEKLRPQVFELGFLPS